MSVSRVEAIKRFAGDERLQAKIEGCRVPKKEGRSLGLGYICHNAAKRRKKLELIKLNLMDQKDIAKEFREMVNRQQGVWNRYYNQLSGELVTIPNASRWNVESSYAWKVRRAFCREIESLKVGKMLTLTFDPSEVAKHMPAWWMFTMQEFLVAYGQSYLSRFLNRLF